MRVRKRARLTPIIVTLAAMTFAQTGKAATAEQSQKALGIISDYAEATCSKFIHDGSSRNLDGKIDMSARTGALVKKLMRLGFSGAVSYKGSKYIGPPREQLRAANNDVRKCKLIVHKDLVEKLIPSAATQTKPTPNSTKNRTSGNKSPIINNTKGDVIIKY